MRAAAIVPAYNEESTVAKVLEVLVTVPEIDEVILVNDGSTDRTSEIAASIPGVRVIDLPENRGKAYAMLKGARSTDAEVLVYFDADLIGLKPEHVIALLEPVLKQEVAMTYGVFTDGRWLTDLAQKVTPSLSGQRAMIREIMDNCENLEDAGYGVEVAISRYVKRHNLPQKRVGLLDVSHVIKEEKLGFVQGSAQRLRMYWEIMRSLRP